MKIVSIPTAKPSDKAQVRIEGLFCSKAQEVEPVLVIRASDPAAQAVAMAYLQQQLNAGVAENVRLANVELLRQIQMWQQNQGTAIRKMDTLEELGAIYDEPKKK